MNALTIRSSFKPKFDLIVLYFSVLMQFRRTDTSLSDLDHYYCYHCEDNFVVTDSTSCCNVLDASSLSAMRIVDIILLAPVDLTARCAASIAFSMDFMLFASICVPIGVSIVVLIFLVLRMASKAAATSLLILVLLVPTGTILISACRVRLLLLLNIIPCRIADYYYSAFRSYAHY